MGTRAAEQHDDGLFGEAVDEFGSLVPSPKQPQRASPASECVSVTQFWKDGFCCD